MGYLRLLPYAVLALAVGAALFFWGYSNTLRGRLAVSNQELAAAKAVNQENEATIGRLTALREQNDKIVLDVSNKLDAINRKQGETNAAINDLEKSNDLVRAYLAGIVPDDLRRLLDGDPGDSAKH